MHYFFLLEISMTKAAFAIPLTNTGSILKCIFAKIASRSAFDCEVHITEMRNPSNQILIQCGMDLRCVDGLNAHGPDFDRFESFHRPFVCRDCRALGGVGRSSLSGLSRALGSGSGSSIRWEIFTAGVVVDLVRVVHGHGLGGDTRMSAHTHRSARTVVVVISGAVSK